VIDSYCERTDASYWSEPLNAVSNLSFIVAAAITWRLARAAGDRAALVLALAAGGIGVGSYIFHTQATRWAMQADIWPIRVFVLLFIGLAVVRFFNTRRWVGVAAAAGFAVVTAATIALGGVVGFGLNGSIGYAPLPIVMVLMAVLVVRKDQRAAFGMLFAAATFVVSLGLRTVDRELCGSLPVGTHFGWHLLNGVVITTMLLVFIRLPRDAEPASADTLRRAGCIGAGT